MSNQEHIALTWLHAMGRRYPTAWESYAQFQADPPEPWPDWCYCPVAAAYAILSNGGDMPPHRAKDIGPLACMAAWRPTKTIYRFDDTLREEILKTPLTGAIPTEVLKRLPTWCVFIETPGFAFLGWPVDGFFAYLEYDPKDQRTELRLMLAAHGKHTGPALIEVQDPEGLQMHLHIDGNATVEQAIKKSMEFSRATAAQQGFKSQAVAPEDDGLQARDDVASLLSLVLYLCADNRDVEEPAPRPPRWVQGKKRVIAPTAPKPAIYTCGARVGAAIRLARERIALGGERAGGGKRAHVRAAHYHHYWTGPRKGERKLILRWLSHILVNTDDDAIGEATLRPVKDEPELEPEEIE